MKKLLLLVLSLASIGWQADAQPGKVFHQLVSTTNVSKQAAFDAIIATADLAHAVVQTSDGQCGAYKETAGTNLCASGDEIKFLKSGGKNKPSTHNLPYAGNTSLTPTNAKVWFKDLTANNIGPRYIDNGNWDRFAEIYNGPPNVCYFETAGSFTAKTQPIDFIMGLVYLPQTADEGTNRIKATGAPATQKLEFIDGVTPDIVLANGNNYIPYQDNVVRMLIRADNTWEAWINGVLKGSGTGRSFSTTEWIWGTNSHALGMHLRYNIAKFGEFTAGEINTIYTNSQLIWPWGQDVKFPYIKEIYYGDATNFDATLNQWTPGRGKTRAFVGGTGVEGATTNTWFIFDSSDPGRYPAADGVLTNHEKIPGSVNVTAIGPGDFVNQISVDGAPLMSGAVAYTTSVTATADLVVANINATQTSFEAVRTSTGTIRLYAVGLGCNNYALDAISFSVTGFTMTKVDPPRGATLDRDDYAVDGQVFDGKEGTGVIKISCVTDPVDNAGVHGPRQAMAWTLDNIL